MPKAVGGPCEKNTKARGLQCSLTGGTDQCTDVYESQRAEDVIYSGACVFRLLWENKL